MHEESDGIITKTDFCNGVRDIVMDTKMSWLDATLLYCERHDIEFEMVPSLLDRQLKDALLADGLDLHLLKRSADEIIL